MSNVHRLEPMPERFATRDEIAELLNVSVDTVDRMRKAGMPSVVFGKKARRFPVAKAVGWAMNHGREAA